MKAIKKLIEETYGLIWTLAGTALVLVTLSGDVKTYALWISGFALLAHFIGALIKKDQSD
jgi:uncharacterized membrane protein